MITLFNTQFGYGNRPVVGAENLALAAGECVGMFGPNGAGKTTLVRGMIGLLKPLAGRVERAGELCVGYLAQHRAMEQHWPMSALDAAAIAGAARCRFGWAGGAIRLIKNALDELDVANLQSRPFSRLSGGQQQRVLLAGVLAAAPNLLVLDEPTDGLDADSRNTLLRVLGRRMKQRVSVVLISHNLEDLLSIASTIAMVHPGSVAGDASTVEIVLPREFAWRFTGVRSVI